MKKLINTQRQIKSNQIGEKGGKTFKAKDKQLKNLPCPPHTRGLKGKNGTNNIKDYGNWSPNLRIIVDT